MPIASPLDILCVYKPATHDFYIISTSGQAYSTLHVFFSDDTVIGAISWYKMDIEDSAKYLTPFASLGQSQLGELSRKMYDSSWRDELAEVYEPGYVSIPPKVTDDANNYKHEQDSLQKLIDDDRNNYIHKQDSLHRWSYEDSAAASFCYYFDLSQKEVFLTNCPPAQLANANCFTQCKKLKKIDSNRLMIHRREYEFVMPRSSFDFFPDINFIGMTWMHKK